MTKKREFKQDMSKEQFWVLVFGVMRMLKEQFWFLVIGVIGIYCIMEVTITKVIPLIIDLVL